MWMNPEYSQEKVEQNFAINVSNDSTLAVYMYDLEAPKNNILERLQDLWSIIKKFKEDDEGIPTCLENQYNTNFKKLNLESDYWKKFNLRFKWPESNEAEAPSVLLIDNWGICIEIIRNPNKIINVVQYVVNDIQNKHTPEWYNRKELEVSLPKLSTMIEHIRKLSDLEVMREQYTDDMKKVIWNTLGWLGVNFEPKNKKK